MTEAETILKELVEHFHVEEKPDWYPRGQYDTLQLAHGPGEYRYWFSVAHNSMDEAAIGHMGSILQRARVLLKMDPGPEITPQAVMVRTNA
jgi:hypothetical protein